MVKESVQVKTNKSHKNRKSTKRPYTMSEKAYAARLKGSIANRPEDANWSGKGGFGDHPENRFDHAKHKAEMAARPRTWQNNYHDAYQLFSVLDSETFYYIASKFKILPEDHPRYTVEASKHVRKILLLEFGGYDKPEHLSNLADTVICTLVKTKEDPKLSIQIMENLEGRAVQRNENINKNENTNSQEVLALREKNKELESQLNRILLATIVEEPPAEIEYSEVMEIDSPEEYEDDE